MFLSRMQLIQSFNTTGLAMERRSLGVSSYLKRVYESGSTLGRNVPPTFAS